MDKQKDKVHFQIERIVFFSDAVIAIAITLLIIEIKAPHIEMGAPFAQQLAQLQHLVPEFVSFAISFAIIIAQWRKHHAIFGRVINYDRKLISLNSLFLFTIAVIPFTTSYFAHNTSVEFYLPILVYGISLILLTTFNYLIFDHITSEQYKLFDESLSEMELMWTKVDYLLFPVALSAGLLAGVADFSIGLIVYVLVLTGGSVINKRRHRVSL
jgi:uncharacterized membrane protein